MAEAARFLTRRLACGALALIAGGLVGCNMGNYSNPQLSIRSATVSDTAADLALTVSNPSDFDLTLTRLQYTLIYGPFPVADGSYEGQHAIPSGGEAEFDLRVMLDSPPVDPTATEIEFTGEMVLRDASNRGDMQIERAAFSVTAPVRR